ncbi:threonine--tRNA ligase [Adlercreutzia equolifaciens subsp. celatus]|uniref:Threonine--tRNA ligase n=2 Tax=Adlercreutzia equolifaciens TaxID=446660 RepID=A0A3N0APP8_9ACTN|nr:threonine--tRNA ligase [Adlercreutzia equolifaciens]MCP2078584.1 threonyl-tRNA synthetase [Adlercreutzia equolifaciens subsp. celatus DSM 18785]RFT91600.1 threonine--tRNA ligase [Adlercreutzia equolifaciens subsp. celatus]RNL36795.1 threonine--tRNA ligase [Adlercreutzia equolifaciens subsp. celatus DSM 18785]BCS57334.1 threonine--tRNA ligase [Adlercreutzia equolifaciens subsp. celatus]
MNIVLPDGSVKELEEGATVADVAASIGAGLARAALAGIVNDTPVDLDAVVSDGDSVAIVTAKSDEGLELMRHSTAHLLAAALTDMYPGVKFGVGPAIENGFYYDIELPEGVTVSPDDFAAIEARMAEIAKSGAAIVRREVSRDEAREIFADQPLKLELIDELPEDETISIYQLGDFTDLCRGPHVPDTGKLGAYKLTKVAGAYWKGDSDNEMLTRIYGTAFFSKKELEEHLHNLEEAEKRDHRKLGRELGIYMMEPMAGVGLPLYLPKGARVIRTLQEWLRRDLYERGYEEVITPHIYNADVWKTSGHYGFYHENMYFFQINEGTDEEPRYSEYGVKPMNCPGHVIIYKNELHSYRDLPLRYFEFGTVYRHEMSGVVHGLLRARGFTQDDAHIFCTKDQVVDEVVAILELVDYIMGTFGFTYEAEISTRPDKSIGTDDMWEHATESLKEACARRGLAYDINEGDGAFYGPKIDIKVKDAIGRTWQCSTVQIDFNMPMRFGLTYRTEDNTEETPWMLHRAIFGSIERFLGILIEHYAGALPLWLAPVQVAVIPIADRHKEAAAEFAGELKAVGGRVEVMDQNEPMKVKIAKAQSQKIPYMIVMGDKEVEEKLVSVRERSEGDLGQWDRQKFIDVIRDAAI